MFVYSKKALMADKALNKKEKEELLVLLRKGPVQVIARIYIYIYIYIYIVR